MSQNYSLSPYKGHFPGKTKNICQKHIKLARSRWAKSDMSQNYSLSPYKGHFPGKTKKNRSTWICLKYNLSTSLLSTLMTYVKNISNWPDPGGPEWDISQNYSLSPYKGNFPGKTKNNRSTWICLKYNLSTSLLSTLMTYVKNISNWPDPGRQKMDMTQNHSLCGTKVIFLENLKTTKPHKYA